MCLCACVCAHTRVSSFRSHPDASTLRLCNHSQQGCSRTPTAQSHSPSCTSLLCLVCASSQLIKLRTPSVSRSKAMQVLRHLALGSLFPPHGYSASIRCHRFPDLPPHLPLAPSWFSDWPLSNLPDFLIPLLQTLGGCPWRQGESLTHQCGPSILLHHNPAPSLS